MPSKLVLSDEDLKQDLLALECHSCEQCNDGRVCALVKKAPVMTAYSSGDQPQPYLCPDHIEQWIEHWNERWEEYYSSVR